MDISWTQLTIICLHRTRQWWKSSDFHVALGIPWRLPQVHNRSWSGMKRLFFSPKSGCKNSCQWRERDSSAMSLGVFVCSDPKLQAHLRRLLRSPWAGNWRRISALCHLQSWNEPILPELGPKLRAPEKHSSYHYKFHPAFFFWSVSSFLFHVSPSLFGDSETHLI